MSATVVALLIAFFAFYSIASHNNMGLLGEPAAHITSDGFSYRDLNKNGVLDPYEDARNTPEHRADNLLYR